MFFPSSSFVTCKQQRSLKCCMDCHSFSIWFQASSETMDGVKIDNIERERAARQVTTERKQPYGTRRKKKSTKLVIISSFFCPPLFFFVLLLMRQLIHSFRCMVRLEQKWQQNYEFQIWKCFISPFYCSALDLLQRCPAQDKRNVHQQK